VCGDGFSERFLFKSSISGFLRFDWVTANQANAKTLVRANFCRLYRTRGSRHIDRRYLHAGRLLTVGAEDLSRAQVGCP